MTPVIWRKAGVHDADALALLGSATFLATFAFDHPGQPLIEHLRAEHSPEYYANALAQPGVDIVMGETPLGAPIGYAMITHPSHPDLQQDGDIELKRIYLLGPWQGGGNGRQLLEQAFAIAVERGAKRMLLSVYENNEKAIAFYARTGFVAIGDTVFMVGDVPFRDIVCARTLI
jgi:ribosomal protein S18 acetylase RimI-like enzyme